jgi:hypothetical protein
MSNSEPKMLWWLRTLHRRARIGTAAAARLQALIATLALIMLSRAVCATEPLPGDARRLQWLRSEATHEWQAMARKLSHGGFDYIVTGTELDGASTTSRRKRVTGRLAGGSFLFTETLIPTRQVSVYGRNDRYEFAISRRQESPWMVSWQSAGRDAESPVGSAYAYLKGMLQLPWSISATPLAKLVHDPRFSIREMQNSTNGTLRLRFSVAPAGADKDDLQGLASGVIVLDPQRHWAVTEYVAEYANGIASSVKLAYSHAGPPQLSRVVFELVTKPGQASRFDIDVKKYDWSAAESSALTLSAFGLPEYEDPANRRRWLILMNVGFILVLVGVVLWRRK